MSENTLTFAVILGMIVVFGLVAAVAVSNFMADLATRLL